MEIQWWIYSPQECLSWDACKGLSISYWRTEKESACLSAVTDPRAPRLPHSDQLQAEQVLRAKHISVPWSSLGIDYREKLHTVLPFSPLCSFFNDDNLKNTGEKNFLSKRLMKQWKKNNVLNMQHCFYCIPSPVRRRQMPCDSPMTSTGLLCSCLLIIWWDCIRKKGRKQDMRSYNRHSLASIVFTLHKFLNSYESMVKILYFFQTDYTILPSSCK